MAFPSEVLDLARPDDSIGRLLDLDSNLFLSTTAQHLTAPSSHHCSDYHQSVSNSRRHDLRDGLLSPGTGHSCIERLLYMVELGGVCFERCPTVVDGLGFH